MIYQQRSRHLVSLQHRHQNQAPQGQERRQVTAQVPQRDERRIVLDHDPRALEADEGDKETAHTSILTCLIFSHFVKVNPYFRLAST